MNSNSQAVKDLIKGWLEYTKKNNISSPEDTDLEKYLVSKGFQAEIINPLIAQLPDKINQYAEPNEKELDDEDIKILNSLQQTIRAHFNRKQLDILKKELAR